MIEKYGEVIARTLSDLRLAETFAAEIAKHPAIPNSMTGTLAEIQRIQNSLRENNIPVMRKLIERLRHSCEMLDFSDIYPAITRIESPLEYAATIGVTDLPADVKALKDRFEDKLKTSWFLHVSSVDLPLYGKRDLFGEKVSKKFPKAIEDIEEAGSCLALGRATASVFHLMRAMEVVVQRLSKSLGIQNTNREWGKLLSDMGKAVEAMPRGSEAEKRRRKRWSEAHTHLYHLKEAWRNDTMHPNKVYTQAQAMEVFNATRVFMSHLIGLL